ncbi:hypothetical protein AB0D04_33065 [Streptomyces sp. NPDC048483]|uniref:hypothetical protein n=1 Tax=Streptomyces sp. NPDC048483 TaxID=3154927 RepID=UPI00342F38F7
MFELKGEWDFKRTKHGLVTAGMPGRAATTRSRSSSASAWASRAVKTRSHVPSIAPFRSLLDAAINEWL